MTEITAFPIQTKEFDPNNFKGEDGREVEVQVNSTHIQWRYAGDSTWTNLIALSELEGPQGAQGPIGQEGPQGPQGQDGVPVELRINSEAQLEWKLENQPEQEWKYLADLDSIDGGGGTGDPLTDVTAGISLLASNEGAAVPELEDGTYNANLLASYAFQVALRFMAAEFWQNGGISLPHNSASPIDSVLFSVGAAEDKQNWSLPLKAEATAPSGTGESFWVLPLDVTNYANLEIKWKVDTSNNGDLWRVIRLGNIDLVFTKDAQIEYATVNLDLSSLTGVLDLKIGWQSNNISFANNYIMHVTDIKLS